VISRRIHRECRARITLNRDVNGVWRTMRMHVTEVALYVRFDQESYNLAVNLDREVETGTTGINRQR